MSILALIPARGGSKGVPKKNIRMLNGLPLIAYTILAAKKVERLSSVVVSTDSREIAGIALKFGGEVPFLRPACLASDTASSIDVVLHAIDWFENRGIHYSHVVLLQPTSPLRDHTDIERSLDIYFNNHCDSLVSVCEAKVHPYLCRSFDEKGRLCDFMPQVDRHVRRQDMPRAYQLNGAIYIAPVGLLKEKRSFYGETVLPYIMDTYKSLDIDTELDFKVAELIMKEREKGGLF